MGAPPLLVVQDGPIQPAGTLLSGPVVHPQVHVEDCVNRVEIPELEIADDQSTRIEAHKARIELCRKGLDLTPAMAGCTANGADGRVGSHALARGDSEPYVDDCLSTFAVA